MRTDPEIEEQLGLALDAQADGSRWPGMSYEQGVENALRWVSGESDTAPMEED
jgi:hypothetical protein